MPEEAPQEIADLVSRCTGDVEERPGAQECVEIIQPFVRAGSLRVSSSQPLTPGTVNSPRRTGFGGIGGGGRTSSGGEGTGGGQPVTPGAGGAPVRTTSGGGGSSSGSVGPVGGALVLGSGLHLQQPQQASTRSNPSGMH